MSAAKPGDGDPPWGDDADAPPADRWDRRYREWPDRFPGTEQPHAWLAAHADALPDLTDGDPDGDPDGHGDGRRGKALDIAAGFGRNAFFLARRGFDVLAVDASAVACARVNEAAERLGLPVTALQRDLEREPLPPGPFDVIVNTLYLQRDLVPAIEAALAPGGVLFFATRVAGPAMEGRRRAGFLLAPGELRGLFPNLETLAYREADSDGKTDAALVARRPPPAP